MSSGPTRMDRDFHRELFFLFFEETGYSSTASPEENAARIALRDAEIHSFVGAGKLAVDLMALHNPSASNSLIGNVKADYEQFLAGMPVPILNREFIMNAAVHVDQLYGY